MLTYKFMLSRIKKYLRKSQEEKLFDRLKPWNTVTELQKLPYVNIGKYTYGLTDTTINRATEVAPVNIGNFCSFAPGVLLLAHVDHRTDLASTYPLKTLFLNSRQSNFDPHWTNQDAISRGGITIGHDVWIGQNAIILSGVSIGNGAIIGAGTVVTKNIPPYAIVVGNPGKVVKYRFSEDIIRKLQRLEWWNFSDNTIEELIPYFYEDTQDFIEESERIKDQHG
jgi:acetyltransferase-like isoleucine patch superfamily enzyme